MILVGDFFQLDPVGSQALFKQLVRFSETADDDFVLRSSGLLHGLDLFSKFRKVELEVLIWVHGWFTFSCASGIKLTSYM